MSYVKNNSYRDMPFSSECSKEDFYTYSSVAALVARSALYREDQVRCRTVGILQSAHGRFFLTDLATPVIKEQEPQIRVSMVFLASPPQSTFIPYPVQIFGTLQWKNRPVLFARILQMLQAPMAIRIQNTMSSVTKFHLAVQDDGLDAFEDLSFGEFSEIGSNSIEPQT